MRRAAKSTLLSLSLLAGGPVVAAEDLSVGLSNNFAEIDYRRDFRVGGLENSQLNAGLLMTENNTLVGRLGLAGNVFDRNSPLSLDVGARLYFVNLTNPDDDIAGVALGARLRYSLAPFHLSTGAYFAPEVVTSGGGTSILDFDVVRLEVDLNKRLSAFAGVRRFKVARDVGGDRKLVDNRVYVGARFDF